MVCPATSDCYPVQAKNNTRVCLGHKIIILVRCCKYCTSVIIYYGTDQIVSQTRGPYRIRIIMRGGCPSVNITSVFFNLFFYYSLPLPPHSL